MNLGSFGSIGKGFDSSRFNFNFGIGGLANFKGSNDFVIAGMSNNSKTSKKNDSHKKAKVSKSKSVDYGYTGYGYGGEERYGSGLSYGLGSNLGYGHGSGYGDSLRGLGKVSLANW